jgi:phage tail-like protein
VADPERDAAPADWDERFQEVTLHQELFQFPAITGEHALAADDRRGVDRDRFGTTYWIDEARTTILAQSAGTGNTTPFWPASAAAAAPFVPVAPGAFAPAAASDPGAPVPLAALTVTRTHYLVVGTLDPPGLMVFDLQSTGPPIRFTWPAAVPFAPFDASSTPDGGAVVLDRTHQRLWTLDAHLQVVSSRPPPSVPDPAEGDFVPGAGGKPQPGVPPGAQREIEAADALGLDRDALGLDSDPVSVVVLRDCSVVVLDRGGASGPSRLLRFRDGAPVGASVMLADANLQMPLVAHDMTLVPDNRLFVADRFGNQAFEFTLGGIGEQQLTATLVRRYYPMRQFGGQGIVSDVAYAYYDCDASWIPLVEQGRPRFSSEAWLRNPSWDNNQTEHSERNREAAFDGREPGCVWHRFMLDARIPNGCSVQVWSRAAEEPWALESTEWTAEPDPLRRRDGPDRPFLRQPDPYGTWELLFQRARGRWLQLRLRLAGDGRSSPHLHSLRVFYPRFSYLEHYLPKLYREDDISASFLDRFLANPEGISTALEDKIAAAAILLDQRAAPAEALEWLASFYDVSLDQAWSEARRRTFLAGAMEFFRWRGTAHGLRMALRLGLDPAADADPDVFSAEENRCTAAYRIVEGHMLRMLPASVAGDPTEDPTPRPLQPGSRWKPVDGRGALFARYGIFLGAGGPVEWPLAAPESGRGPWRAFTAANLGFIPAATSSNTGQWQEFLARRYRTVDTLSSRYGQSYETFADVGLPGRLPADGAALRDWYQFETIVLAMGRTAHRFTVLLPVPVGESAADTSSDAQRKALAQRIIDLQKPAHTAFDIRLYWAAFRLGQARLGEGTAVGLGSRSPRLLRPLALGADYVGESYLAGPPPDRLTDPPSLGRRPIASAEQETT